MSDINEIIEKSYNTICQGGMLFLKKTKFHLIGNAIKLELEHLKKKDDSLKFVALKKNVKKTKRLGTSDLVWRPRQNRYAALKQRFSVFFEQNAYDLPLGKLLTHNPDNRKYDSMTGFPILTAYEEFLELLWGIGWTQINRYNFPKELKALRKLAADTLLTEEEDILIAIKWQDWRLECLGKKVANTPGSTKLQEETVKGLYVVLEEEIQDHMDHYEEELEFLREAHLEDITLDYEISTQKDRKNFSPVEWAEINTSVSSILRYVKKKEDLYKCYFITLDNVPAKLFKIVPETEEDIETAKKVKEATIMSYLLPEFEKIIKVVNDLNKKLQGDFIDVQVTTFAKVADIVKITEEAARIIDSPLLSSTVTELSDAITVAGLFGMSELVKPLSTFSEKVVDVIESCNQSNFEQLIAALEF